MRISVSKNGVLKNLKENVYCRLRPSKIHGVGVFAIKTIPKYANPFIGCHPSQWIGFYPEELSSLEPAVKQMINDFFAVQGKKVWVPACGFNGMDISFFMNSSRNPNIESTEGGARFYALKKIKKGEELTIDYQTFDEKTQ